MRLVVDDREVKGEPTDSSAGLRSFSARTEISCLLGDLSSGEKVALELAVIPTAAGDFSVAGTASTTPVHAYRGDNSDDEEADMLER